MTSIQNKILRPFVAIFLVFSLLILIATAVFSYKQLEKIAYQSTGYILESLSVYIESLASFKPIDLSFEIDNMIEQLAADEHILEISIAKATPYRIIISSDKKIEGKWISELDDTHESLYKEAFDKDEATSFDLFNGIYDHAVTVLLTNHSNASGLHKSVVFLRYDISYQIKEFLLNFVLIVLGLISVVLALSFVLWKTLRKHVFSPLKSLTTQIENYQKYSVSDHKDITLSFSIIDRDELVLLSEVLNDTLKSNSKHTKELIHATKKANEANVAKSEFLANMSHEIRTPLNGVIGMAQAMLLHDLSEEQQDRAETILLSGEQLLSLLNDVLDLSKIEAGEVVIDYQKLYITELVERIRKLWEPAILAKGLELHILQRGHFPEFFFTDLHRLFQVINNLIANAIKFTEVGEITVQLSANPINETEYLFCFDVTDTGIGIPLNKQMTLFEKFTQVDSSTTRKYGGTGLGLAICREIVEMFHGEIGVLSSEGEGSTFSFVLRVSIEEPHL